MFGFAVEYELLKKPGVYMITDLTTGRQYIGYSTNVYRRIRTHAKAVGRPEELRQLIEANSTSRFKTEALYYSFGSDETHLAEVETDLISCYETLFPKGFNVVLYMNDPTHRAAIAKAVSQSGARTKMSDSRKLWLQDPENRERHRLTSIARTQGTIWITDGNNTLRVPSNEPIPEGWRRGRPKMKPYNRRKLETP